MKKIIEEIDDESLIEDEFKSNQENSQLESNCYGLKLTVDKIQLIDCREKFTQFVKDILRQSEKGNLLIGVDTEWKPTCVMGVVKEDKRKVAVIQMSTFEFVYLLDMVKLVDELTDDDKKCFSDNILFNKKIVKLGYGFTQDLKMVGQSFNVSDMDAFRQTVLDLSYLAHQVTTHNSNNLYKNIHIFFVI